MAKIIQVIREISDELGTSHEGAGDLFLTLRQAGGVDYMPGQGWRLHLHGQALGRALTAHIEVSTAEITRPASFLPAPVRLFLLNRRRSTKLFWLRAVEAGITAGHAAEVSGAV